MKSSIPESILDAPRDTLCPEVWNLAYDPPVLADEAQEKIQSLVQWVQDKYQLDSLSVYIIGSICSNSYSDTSDIDIDFCAQFDGSDDEEKEFAWKLKKDVVDSYFSQNEENGSVEAHPLEVYFSSNPFQCFMSVGCYNFLDKRWEVGPQMKDSDFDPVSYYYDDAMKQASKILKDVRSKIFELYEAAFACKKSSNDRFKAQQHKKIESMLEDAAKLYDSMKKVRSNFQKPCKSKEEALTRRKDKKLHVVDAAFKFFDKFGYVQMLKDFMELHYALKDGECSDEDAVDKILSSVSSNMQLKHLQDSDDEQDLKLMSMIQELDGTLAESASGLVKLSVIAGLMAVSGLLPVDALQKNLAKAKKQDTHLTVSSPAVKKAVAASAKSNEMVGPMSKTNVVNAVAEVLWKEARGSKEGTAGRKAVASVILNRTGDDPKFIVDVIKQPYAFSCLNDYTGGWTDATYQWFVPYDEMLKDARNQTIWNECNQIALQLVNKKFKSTIGDRNAYLNKDTADANAVDTWGSKCDLKVGSHSFGYLRDRDPAYVVPGTFTPRAKKSITVKAGDTLSKIAKQHNTTVKKLMNLNKSLTNPNSLSIGQKLRVS